VADPKEKTAILVSASIIAAVRLAREPIKELTEGERHYRR